MPSIHRELARDAESAGPAPDAGRDAAVAQPLGTLEDSDAGADYNPEKDPANRNESLEAFEALLPRAHLFAEWPMPDSAPESKHKPSYTVSEQLVTDNVTKLKWQRDLPDVYPGCTANYVYVGRPRGVGTGCTWEEAIAYCKRPELAKLLGGGTWRLPTKIELESLLEVSRINPIDPSLDDFPIDRVWSANPMLNPEGLKLAWAVDYMEGASYDSGRFKGGRVRCVSSENEKGGAEPSYTSDRDIVHDNNTELSWQRYQDSAARNWSDALAYCAELALDGGGWRLPSVKELLTIVDTSRRLPATQLKAFFGTQNEVYWTASVFLDGRNIAYSVDFKAGGAGTGGTMDDLHYVRCVR